MYYYSMTHIRRLWGTIRKGLNRMEVMKPCNDHRHGYTNLASDFLAFQGGSIISRYKCIHICNGRNRTCATDASTRVSKRYAKTWDHPNPVNNVPRKFVSYENQRHILH